MTKIVTDISQSKLLAEILPLESADMGWNIFVDDTTRILPINDWDLVKDGSGSVKFYPAWSLAALLNILNTIDGWYPGIDVVTKNMWQICMFSYQTGSDIDLSSVEEELVDVCYEVILKLHELNLL